MGVITGTGMSLAGSLLKILASPLRSQGIWNLKVGLTDRQASSIMDFNFLLSVSFKTAWPFIQVYLVTFTFVGALEKWYMIFSSGREAWPRGFDLSAAIREHRWQTCKFFSAIGPRDSSPQRNQHFAICQMAQKQIFWHVPLSTIDKHCRVRSSDGVREQTSLEPQGIHRRPQFLQACRRNGRVFFWLQRLDSSRWVVMQVFTRCANYCKWSRYCSRLYVFVVSSRMMSFHSGASETKQKTPKSNSKTQHKQTKQHKNRKKHHIQAVEWKHQNLQGRPPLRLQKSYQFQVQKTNPKTSLLYLLVLIMTTYPFLLCWFKSLQSRRFEARRGLGEARRGLGEATLRTQNVLAQGQSEAHGDSKLYNTIVEVPGRLNLKLLVPVLPR